jgi:hypothetical protein
MHLIDLVRFKVSMHGNAYILCCGNKETDWSLISTATRIETVLRQYAPAQLASPFLNIDSFITRMKSISGVLHQSMQSLKYKGSISNTYGGI